MLTIEKLNEYGANAEEGLARCLGNESFYFKMITLALTEESYDTLGAALENKNVQEAFEQAHKLKGVLANLSLTPMYEAASELTEILRAGSLEGSDEAFSRLIEKRDRLLSIAG